MRRESWDAWSLESWEAGKLGGWEAGKGSLTIRMLEQWSSGVVDKWVLRKLYYGYILKSEVGMRKSEN